MTHGILNFKDIHPMSD